jgi:hypothetical protein
VSVLYATIDEVEVNNPISIQEYENAGAVPVIFHLSHLSVLD